MLNWSRQRNELRKRSGKKAAPWHVRLSNDVREGSPEGSMGLVPTAIERRDHFWRRSSKVRERGPRAPAKIVSHFKFQLDLEHP